jgi:hypothetical protein
VSHKTPPKKKKCEKSTLKGVNETCEACFIFTAEVHRADHQLDQTKRAVFYNQDNSHEQGTDTRSGATRDIEMMKSMYPVRQVSGKTEEQQENVYMTMNEQTDEFITYVIYDWDLHILVKRHYGHSPGLRVQPRQQLSRMTESTAELGMYHVQLARSHETEQQVSVYTIEPCTVEEVNWLEQGPKGSRPPEFVGNGFLKRQQSGSIPDRNHCLKRLSRSNKEVRSMPSTTNK